MVFVLYPALVLAIANAGAAIPAVSATPSTAVAEPTFNPDYPPSWWMDKMRQPCTKTGTRVVC